MHCVSREFRKRDGKWEAVDKLIQPQGERCLVLMDPPKTHSAGGLELPEEYQEVTWEGEVKASGPQSNYMVGDRVVVGKHAGIQEMYAGGKNIYVVATNDEVIHKVSTVVRDLTADELAKMTAEDDAKAALAKARSDLVSRMNRETQDVVEALSQDA